MDEYGTVSIIVPCYKSGAWIAETVDSVLAQTYQDWELILIDDCSPDDTFLVLKEISQRDPRIQCHQTQHNFGGPAGPRNLGVSHAQGRWIAFLDTDDLWHPQKLQLQLQFLVKNGYQFSCTTHRCFSGEAPLRRVGDLAVLQRVEMINWRKLLRKNFIPNSTVVLAASLLQGRRFREDRDCISVEDYDMWLEITHSGTPCYKLHLPTMDYRVLETSISRDKFQMLVKVARLINRRLRDFEQPRFLLFLYLVTYIVYSIL